MVMHPLLHIYRMFPELEKEKRRMEQKCEAEGEEVWLQHGEKGRTANGDEWVDGGCHR